MVGGSRDDAAAIENGNSSASAFASADGGSSVGTVVVAEALVAAVGVNVASLEDEFAGILLRSASDCSRIAAGIHGKRTRVFRIKRAKGGACFEIGAVCKGDGLADHAILGCDNVVVRVEVSDRVVDDENRSPSAANAR